MDRSNPEYILNEYITRMSANKVVQHSTEWHELRKYGIGGSQICKVIGSSEYGTMEEFLHEKVGITTFSSNEYTQWGNLFEEVVKTYIEIAKNCVILGDSIFDDSQIDKGIYYSPDGLTVIDGKITLMEFKCPFKRKLNNKIPSHYLSQVQMGLDIIRICDSALYVEAVFRYCSLEQMNFVKGFNASMNQPGMGKNIEAIGFIGFTNSVENAPDHKFIDFGAKEDIKDLLKIANSGAIECHYFIYTPKKSHPKDGYSLQMYLEEFKNCNKNVIGVLPWKLIRVDIHSVERENDFLKTHEPKIQEVVKILRDCKGKSPDECKKIIDAFVNPNCNDGDDICL